MKGGRYGQPPSLTTLDARGNLVHTVDFRSMYATAVQGWLGVDAEAILGNGFAPLPLSPDLPCQRTGVNSPVSGRLLTQIG